MDSEFLSRGTMATVLPPCPGYLEPPVPMIVRRANVVRLRHPLGGTAGPICECFRRGDGLRRDRRSRMIEHSLVYLRKLWVIIYK